MPYIYEHMRQENGQLKQLQQIENATLLFTDGFKLSENALKYLD